MTHEKTFEAIDKLKDVEVELHRLKNALEMANRALEAKDEPVQWGVDWGKAGDIPCACIIKRLPEGKIEVVAVEYAPYSVKEKA